MRPISPYLRWSRNPIRLAHSGSSSRWLARQQSDPFVRQRAESNTLESGPYRSRAAFKLLEIQEKYDLIRAEDTVVDLGCAPGAWLQVAVEMMEKDGCTGTLVGVDLLRTDPLEGAIIIEGDFLARSTYAELMRSLGIMTANNGIALPVGPCVDVLLSDMAPNISGNRTSDVARSLELSEAATSFAMRHLIRGTDGSSGNKRRGGCLVMKFFAHPELTEFKDRYLTPYFRRVDEFKPKSSRKESSETYWVCIDLQPPKEAAE